MAEIKYESNSKSSSKSPTKWINLSALPFTNHSNLIKINETEFIAVPFNLNTSANGQKSDGLYKYNVNNNKWSLYFKYPNNLLLPPEAISIDYKSNKLYVYDKQDKSLVIFNLSSRDVVKYYLPSKIDVQSSAIINGKYNIICTNKGKHHMLWDLYNNDLKVVHKKITKTLNGGSELIHIKSKNALLLFVRGNEKYPWSLYSYSIEKSQWKELKTDLMSICSKFAYAISNDEKYIIIFYKNVRNIDIMNLSTMMVQRSSIEIPIDAQTACNAIIIRDEIHLIKQNGKSHWKIKLQHVIESIENDNLIQNQNQNEIKQYDDLQNLKESEISPQFPMHQSPTITEVTELTDIKEEYKYNEELMDVASIRFTQKSINDTFSCGAPIKWLIYMLKTNQIEPCEIPLIRVGFYNGYYKSIDNRRLYCYKTANIKKIPVTLMKTITKEFCCKDQSPNNGVSVQVIHDPKPVSCHRNIVTAYHPITGKSRTWTVGHIIAETEAIITSTKIKSNQSRKCFFDERDIKKSAASTAWIKLNAFPYLLHSNFIMINDKEFIAASDASQKQRNQQSDGLYKYNIMNDEWHLYFKYPYKLSLGWMSMDYAAKKLYVNNKQKQSVVTFDLLKGGEMKQYKQKNGKKKIGGSTKSAIINRKYHVIRGNMNNKHLIWNTNAQRFDVVYKWSEEEGKTAGHGLVHIKSKNCLLLFGGIQNNMIQSDLMWYYSIDNAIWTKLEQKLPYKCSKFAYILSNDEKYIILIAANRNNIDILNLSTMTFQRSSIKAPTASEYRAIITPKNEIHLIRKTRRIHWKIKLKDILRSIEIDNLCQKKTRRDPPKEPYVVNDDHEQDMKDNDIMLNGDDPLHSLKQITFEIKVNELKQKLIGKQKQIDTLKESVKKLTLSNIKLLNEKKDIDQKCVGLTKLIKYKFWSVNDVYQWIISVDNKRYNKYSNVLKMNLKQENIDGQCLDMINIMDLDRIGITDSVDKQSLKKSIDGLIKNNNNGRDEELPICIICYKDKINYVVEPCHHLYCKQCAVKIKQCSKCRTAIKSSFQIYD